MLYFYENGRNLVTDAELMDDYFYRLKESKFGDDIRNQSFDEWLQEDIFPVYFVGNSELFTSAPNNEKLYFDTEYHNIITESQLYTEFGKMSYEEREEYDFDFKTYRECCMTSENGTLIPISNYTEFTFKA